MKKYLLIIVAALVVLGAGVAVSLHYKKYQNKQVHAQRVQEDKEARLAQELEAEKAKNASLLTQYETVRIECEKGLGAYGLLNTIQTAQIGVTEAPVCGPAVVQ